MLPWYYAPGYMSGAILAWCLYRGNYRYAMTAGLLFQVWLICFATCQITGESMPWGWRIAIDIASAFTLIFFGGVCEALIGIMFALEVNVHVAYGWSTIKGPPSPFVSYDYWWAMFYIACGQCLILAGAYLNGGGKGLRVGSPYRGGPGDGFSNHAGASRTDHSMVQGRVEP